MGTSQVYSISLFPIKVCTFNYIRFKNFQVLKSFFLNCSFSSIVFLNRVQSPPPQIELTFGNVQRHFFIVATGNGVGCCYWVLMSIAEGCHSHPVVHGTATTTRSYWPKMSIVQKLRNLLYKFYPESNQPCTMKNEDIY